VSRRWSAEPGGARSCAVSLPVSILTMPVTVDVNALALTRQTPSDLNKRFSNSRLQID
jgi:hypothetical protein